ncbi:MAG: methyltransferase domain-containing protein, partial [Desulfobacteraceae bacterium]
IEAIKIGVQDQLHYSVADATELQFGNERFSHILGGCNFAFIQLREKALKECHRVLEKAGCLCVSNFFYSSPPPVELLDSIYDIINFRPGHNWTHAFWDNFFSTIFTKKRSKIKNLPIINEADLKIIIKNLIYENSPHLKKYNDQIRRICFERLFRTRKLLNEHRKYQKYTVEVWEK